MPPMNQAQWSYFVQKDLSRHFAVQYGKFQSMIPTLFERRTPDQAIVYEALEGDLGAVAIFDADVSYDDAKQSYRKSVEEVERALGIKVTKKLRRNDLYGVVQRKVRNLADRFRASDESIGSALFNGAFSTATTADGLAICHTAHTSDVGGSSQGNKGTSAFSPAAVEATRRLMIAFKTNRDNIQAASFPDTLLVPTALEEKGYELIKTKGKVDTALNNANFHEGKYKLAVWHNWLSSSTNWFMLNLERWKDESGFYVWNDTEFFFAGEVDTLVSKHVGYSSKNAAATDWRGIYGHQPS